MKYDGCAALQYILSSQCRNACPVDIAAPQYAGADEGKGMSVPAVLEK